MISSLQQLHSTATHSRNFLLNFQVALSEQQTRGRVFSRAWKGTKEGTRVDCLRTFVNDLKREEETPPGIG